MPTRRPTLWITLGVALFFMGLIVIMWASSAEREAQLSAYDNLMCSTADELGLPMDEEACSQEDDRNYGAWKALGASGLVSGALLMCLGGYQKIATGRTGGDPSRSGSFWFPSTDAKTAEESPSDEKSQADDLRALPQFESKVPTSVVAAAPAPDVDIDRRPCPRCAEMIAIQARMCRFCQLDLASSSAS